MFTASIVSTWLSFLRNPVSSSPSYHSADSPPPPAARSPVFMLINQELVLSFCVILLIVWHNSFLSPRYLYFPRETGHIVSWYLYRFACMLSFRLQCWFFVLYPTWHCWRTHESILHLLFLSLDDIFYFDGLHISPAHEELLHPCLSFLMICRIVFLFIFSIGYWMW